MKDNTYIMQFKINNETASAKKYSLFDTSASLADGGAFSVVNKNDGGEQVLSAGDSIGQTWKQNVGGRLTNVSFKIRIQTLATFTYFKIYNYDTGALIFSDTIGISGSFNSIVVLSSSPDIYLDKDTNYYFKLTAAASFSVIYDTSASYSGGVAIFNGATQSYDLWFEIDYTTASDSDISYTGDMTYGEIVRSFQGAPVKINRLTIIAPDADQLQNNVTFTNNQSTGEIRDFEVNVQGYISPLDVTTIVRIPFPKGVIFGASQNEAIEYTVNANSEVTLIFGFSLAEKTYDLKNNDNIEDAEIITDETKEENTNKNKLYQTLKTVLNDSRQPTADSQSPIAETKKPTADSRLSFVAGFIIAILLTAGISKIWTKN